MTIAITTRTAPPSVELKLERSFERELLDAAFAVLSREVEPGALIVRVIAGSERVPGLVTMLQVDDEVRNGLTVLVLQVVHMPAPHVPQAVVTRMELPTSLRGRGIARGMLRDLLATCVERNAVLVLLGLDDIQRERLLKRGAHRLDVDAVQLTANTRFD